MPELLSPKYLKQFSYGFNLELEFTDFRVDKTQLINAEDDSDTWKVIVVKPDGTSFTRTTADDGLSFRSNSTAAITVPIYALDLDRRGTYSYQVIKTTGDDAEVKSDVLTFDVAASLPINLPMSAPTSPSEGFFPIYDAQGALSESTLQVEGGVLKFDGSAVGGGTSFTGDTDDVDEGATNLYFTEARVRASDLTGLGAGTNAAIASTDTVLEAFAKIQNQISNLDIPSEITDSDDVTEGATNLYFTEARVRNSVLTGLGAGANTEIAATDTVIEALANLQNQISNFSGGGGIDYTTSGTSDYLPKFDGTGFEDSLINDDGTKVVVTSNQFNIGGTTSTDVALTSRGSAMLAINTGNAAAGGSFEAKNYIVNTSESGQFGFAQYYGFNSSIWAGFQSAGQSGIIKVTNGSSGGGGIEFKEISTPSNPPAESFIIYAEDNGSGKTKVMALFSDGSTAQLAVQP